MTDIPLVGGAATTAIAGVQSDITATDAAINTAEGQLAGTQAAESSGTITSNSSKTSVELKKEIEILKSEQKLNYRKMERIEAEIRTLTRSIKQHMRESEALQKKAYEGQQEKADKAVEQCIKDYIAANKEGSNKPMSKEQLKTNIAGAVGAVTQNTDFSDAVAEFVIATQEMREIDSLLCSMNSIIIDTNGIEIELKNKNNAYTQALAAEQPKKSCDPIGFKVGDNQYDFIIWDGAFDETTDFLGADSQWAAMEQLNTNGDKIVDLGELEAKGIKLVKTDATGKQSVVDIEKEFGENFSVNLDFNKDGKFEGLSTGDHDGDNVADQTLLGTFTLNIGGKTITGYDTDDDVDYLASHYGIKAASFDDSVSAEYSDELKPHSNFFRDYKKVSSGLEKDLEDLATNIGIGKALLDKIKDGAKEAGEQDANIFLKKMEKEEQEKLAAEKAEQKAEEQEQAKAIFKGEGVENVHKNDCDQWVVDTEEAVEGDDTKLSSPNSILKNIYGITDYDSDDAKKILQALMDANPDVFVTAGDGTVSLKPNTELVLVDPNTVLGTSSPSSSSPTEVDDPTIQAESLIPGAVVVTDYTAIESALGEIGKTVQNYTFTYDDNVKPVEGKNPPVKFMEVNDSNPKQYCKVLDLNGTKILSTTTMVDGKAQREFTILGKGPEKAGADVAAENVISGAKTLDNADNQIKILKENGINVTKENLKDPTDGGGKYFQLETSDGKKQYVKVLEQGNHYIIATTTINGKGEAPTRNFKFIAKN
ncbi:MAG: hypothetical protein IJ877_05015 [Candidatus Gastranaerophilales bacterium]|nr:hypothetical protein [Candidatus Gastranaerophilales bacterium]